MPDDDTQALHCDLLVIGSGAGGLSAAVTAAHHGLSVIVAEKEPCFGGTSAWSGGWMWIPGNPLARAAGIHESLQAPLAYLRHELGPQFDAARLQAYLEQGPAMVDFFQRHTALQFVDGNAIPDFHGRSPNAGTGGRSVCAAPFDGRRLGNWLAQLRPPLAETTVWGMGIASGAELRHCLQARQNPRSAWVVAQLLARHLRDRLLLGRGARLVNGNALVAALALSLRERGGQMLLQSPAVQLLRAQGRISGALLATPQGRCRVHAGRGVLLACGGFAHDAQRLRALLPEGAGEHWSAGARGNTGDGLRLAESVGAVVPTGLHQPVALAPVSLVPRARTYPDLGAGPDGVAHFPHLIERGKPGLLAVTPQGQRFANEADSYHDFMQALLRATPAGSAPQAWLVCDHAFLRYYGLGAVKPAPFPLGRWLRNGYLRRGDTLQALAVGCAIDPQALHATVARYNAQARSGRDDDFGKGETPYNRLQGDAARAQALGYPNPCMAPLEHGPFYAVRVVMGSLGTFAGLAVNAYAQVLNAQGDAIPGLYAAGNDQSSVMGGHYPAGGITLGPAMTFGYLAALHLAQQDANGPAAVQDPDQNQDQDQNSDPGPEPVQPPALTPAPALA